MATDRQVDAISIGIGANLNQLREQLRQANTLIKDAPLGDRVVTIRIQTQLAGDIERDVQTAIGKLAAISEKARPPIHPELKVNRADTRAFAKAIKDEITGNGGIKVPISADLNTAKALNKTIAKAIGVVNVQLSWSWKDGPPPTEFNGTVNGTGGGGGTSGGGGGTRARASTPRRPSGGGGTAAGATQERPAEPHSGPVAGGVLTRPARPARPARARASGTATAAPSGPRVNNLGGTVRDRSLSPEEQEAVDARPSFDRQSPQRRVFEQRLREDKKLRAEAEAVGITFHGNTVDVPWGKKGGPKPDSQKFWEEHSAEPLEQPTDWHSLIAMSTGLNPKTGSRKTYTSTTGEKAAYQAAIQDPRIVDAFADLKLANSFLGAGLHTIPPNLMSRLLSHRNKFVGNVTSGDSSLRAAWAQGNPDFWQMARDVDRVKPETLAKIPAYEAYNAGLYALGIGGDFAKERDKVKKQKLPATPTGVVPKPRLNAPLVGEPGFLGGPGYEPSIPDVSRYAANKAPGGTTMADAQAAFDRLAGAKTAHREMFGRNKLRGSETVEEIEAMIQAGAAQGLTRRPGRAGGGPINPNGPLGSRLYRVAENRDELFVGKSGNMQVLKTPAHQWAAPEPGEIKPFVPAWIERMDKNAKDLTGRAAGGPVDPLDIFQRGGFRPRNAAGSAFRKVTNEEKEMIAAYRQALSTPFSDTPRFNRGRAYTPGEKQLADAYKAAVKQLAPEWVRQYGSRAAYIATQAQAHAQAQARVAASGPTSFQTAQQHAAALAGQKYAPVGPGAVNPTDLLNEDALGLTREQLANIKIQARQSTLEARLKGVKLRGVTAAELSTLAQRSTPLGIAQFTSTKFGRGESVERAKLAQAYVGEANFYASQAAAERKVIYTHLENIATIKAFGPAYQNADKEIAVHEEIIAGAEKSEKAFNTENEKFLTFAEATTEKIGGAGKVIKNFTAQISGAITGTLLYGGAFTGIQAAISLGGEGLKRFIDLSSGFYLTTNLVTGALKDQTEKMNGNAKAAVLTATAQAGMSGAIAATTTATLAQRAAGEAGNDQLKTQLDLIRSANQVSQQNGGFFAANGIDRSTLLGTGGLDIGKGFNIGGQGSTLEQVVGGLAGLSPGTNLPGGDIGQFALKTLPFGVGPVAGAIAQNADQTNATSAIQNFNANIIKAGGTQQFTRAGTVDQQKTQAAIFELGQAVPQASDELTKFAQELSAGGLAIKDANGNVVKSAGDLAIVLQNIQKGALTPTSQGLLDANARQRQAQLGQIAAELNHTIQTLVPISEAMQYFGNRPLPFGAGIVPSVGGANAASYPGVGNLAAVGTVPGQGNAGLAGAVAAFGKYANIAGPALKAVQLDAEEGRQQILSQLSKASTVLPASQQKFINATQGIGGPFGGAFAGFGQAIQAQQTGIQNPTALFNQYEAIGKQVQGLQQGIVSEQAALALTQYNHQLFLTERSYKDALGLAGKLGGANSDNLGVLQRETFELQKQSEALSLQLQQRQINFQVAVAGFTAPGLTSEERAAREKEALVEANYAQKQLNISKKEFGVGVKVFDVSAVRQVQDVGIALSDLRRQFITQNDVNARLQAINALQAHAANLAVKINAYLGTEEQKFQQAVSETTQIVAVTGDAFGAVEAQAARAWNSFTTDAVKSANAIVSAFGGGAAGGGGGGGTRHLQAPGYLGTANTPTTFTVGEAGSETVAILRNARQMTIGGGGNGGSHGSGNTIVVNITGNHVRNDDDLRELKAFILRTLNEKAALTGLRGGVFG